MNPEVIERMNYFRRQYWARPGHSYWLYIIDCVEELEMWAADRVRLSQLIPCATPSCRAAAGQPCLNKKGEHVWHKKRVELSNHLGNSTNPQWWLNGCMHTQDAHVVNVWIEQIRNCALYRELQGRGLLHHKLRLVREIATPWASLH